MVIYFIGELKIFFCFPLMLTWEESIYRFDVFFSKVSVYILIMSEMVANMDKISGQLVQFTCEK